jgi:hypothetical protein
VSHLHKSYHDDLYSTRANQFSREAIEEFSIIFASQLSVLDQIIRCFIKLCGARSYEFVSEFALIKFLRRNEFALYESEKEALRNFKQGRFLKLGNEPVVYWSLADALQR